MKTLSTYLIVKNEENVIERCIKSLLSFSDEIIITDTGSTDKTKEIVKNLNNEKIKIYDFEWCDNFSKARNFSLNKTTCDYVLTTDADEVFEEKLQNGIIELKKRDFDGYTQIFLPLTNFKDDGKELNTLFYDSRSIISKECLPYWKNPVHESLHFNSEKKPIESCHNSGRILHKKHNGAMSNFWKYKEIYFKTLLDGFELNDFDSIFYYYFNITLGFNDTPLSKKILVNCFYPSIFDYIDFRKTLLDEDRISQNEYIIMTLISNPSIKQDAVKIKELVDNLSSICDGDYAKYIGYEFIKENKDNILFNPYLKKSYQFLLNEELKNNFPKDYIETSKLLYDLDETTYNNYSKAFILNDFIKNTALVIKSDKFINSLAYYGNRYFDNIFIISNEKNTPSVCKKINSINEINENDFYKILIIDTKQQLFSEEFNKIYQSFKNSKEKVISITK